MYKIQLYALLLKYVMYSNDDPASPISYLLYVVSVSCALDDCKHISHEALVQGIWW